MRTVFSYLRLILFLAGVLVGVQVPVFVEQYGSSLEAHFLEAEKSLQGFQEDADKYFGGDMQALIAHYLENGDPVFRDGGKSLQALYARFTALQAAWSSFTRGIWNAYAQAVFDPVADIQKEVLDRYAYAIRLDPAAILFGLAAGLLLSIAAELVLRALTAALAALFRRLR